MYLQPIIDLATGRTVAAEALARFPRAPQLPVGSIFARAHEVGGGVELEASCVRAARARQPELPPGIDLAINVSPDAVEHPVMHEALEGDLSGVILEVTEQPAADPVRLARALHAFRERGARVAVDDVTTGHAGLMRLAELRPDVIKIDRGAVRDIRVRTEQVAVVEALVSMGRRLGCRVLAEGVESLADLSALARLDVDLVQGWAIATAAPTLEPVGAEVHAACVAARREVLQLVPTPRVPTRTVDIHHVTADLARVAHQVELDRALASASNALGMTMIAVSQLGEDDTLREVIATGLPIDAVTYPLAEYPATAAALRDRVMLEVAVDQSDADPHERSVLERLGVASLLLVPLVVDGRALGVLELFRDTTRRWTTREIDDARILGQHVGQALARIGEAV